MKKTFLRTLLREVFTCRAAARAPSSTRKVISSRTWDRQTKENNVQLKAPYTFVVIIATDFVF